MSSLLVVNRVYRLEIQSVTLVFLTQLCERLPLSNLSLVHLPHPSPLPPSQSQSTVDTDHRVWLGGGGSWGLLSCVGDHILQEFNTLFLTRFITYKIATPPQTKT
jgi:hypothetical protein